MKLLILELLFFICTAHATEYFWYEDGAKHTIYLQEDLIAYFGEAPQAAEDTSEKAMIASLNLVSESGNTRIYKIANTEMIQAKSTAPAADKTSPVFSNSKNGTSYRALPGGLLVTFKNEMTEENIKDWAKQNNIEIDKKLNIIEQNIWSFKTQSGLASLDLANSFVGQENIVTAQPNWWFKVESRSKIKIPKKSKLVKKPTKK